MSHLRSVYLSLPEEPGVYLFSDEKGIVLYVGKAKNLKSRVSSYFTSPNDFGEKTKALVERIAKIKTIRVGSEVESLLLEASLVKKYKPQFNIRLLDNKAYPVIRITVGDAYPKVLIARREEDPKSKYFGPYPNAGSLRLVLKTIRRIFPFQSVENHPNRICLYHHLGLCPCPTVIPGQKIEYRKNIFRIIRLLEGQTKSVITLLEKERNSETGKEHFEKAEEIQKKIAALLLITNPVHKPFDYQTNPNLLFDIRNKETTMLRDILIKNGLDVPHALERIECYDISNISGTNAVGSMVVFTNGEKDSSQYRRFKIRYTPGPNDFAMHQEVMTRRLSHTEWQYPGLMIIDGGKGQVSSVYEVLEKGGKDIPLIGIAKREEEIIIPHKDSDSLSFTTVRLPHRSEALQLVMRIRDEAHRFAITYHRKIRSRKALEM